MGLKIILADDHSVVRNGVSIIPVNKGVATAGSGDAWILKLNAMGGITWQQLYGGSTYEIDKDIRQTTEGGYINLIYSNSPVSGNITGPKPGSGDAWILKLTNLGAISWQKLYGGTSAEQVNCIIQTADGGYIMAGNTSSSATGNVTGTCNGTEDLWVVKMNNVGTIAWQRLYGGAEWDLGSMIVQISDGSYLIAASTQSSGTGNVPVNNGSYNIWVLKLNATGGITWQASVWCYSCRRGIFCSYSTRWLYNFRSVIKFK